jgi:hypothetical protein
MDLIETMAEHQANFDGRKLIEMPRGERERYRERARIAIADMEKFRRSAALDELGKLDGELLWPKEAEKGVSARFLL